jgi:hypothetical protein
MHTFQQATGWLARLVLGGVGALALAVNATAPAAAISFQEPFPDAGETLGTAAVVDTAPFLTPLDEITGKILNPFGGADLYLIYLTGTFFSADTNDSSGLFALRDAQLFLFDSQGKGVFWDDDSGKLLQAEFSLTDPTPGLYYLGISGYNYDPVSASGFIFEGSGGGPTGPGGADPLVGWQLASGRKADIGKYTISLTGATFVPEPSGAVGLLLAGLGGAAMRRRYRPVARGH